MLREHPHEEMGIHSRLGRRFVDGVRDLQQIIAPSEDEQLSGSLCGKVGAVQGHRPVRWDRSGFQYLAGADKCSGMDRGGSCRPFDNSLAVTIRSMSLMAGCPMLRALAKRGNPRLHPGWDFPTQSGIDPEMVSAEGIEPSTY